MAHKRLKKYSSALLPAHDAAAANDVSSLRKMLSSDLAAPPTLSEDGDSPLHSAAKEGANDAIDWLLKNTTIDPQCPNKNGETAAHQAAAGGHLKSLMKLVDADPEQREQVAKATDSQGLTLLHHATVRGKVKVIKWLLDEFGESVFAENENGQLSIHFAASSGNLEALKLLLHHSGLEAANSRDQNGTTAVYFAAQEGRLECLRYLVREAGADPLAKARDGMTSVHAATQGGHLDTVKWLIHKLGQEKLTEISDEDGATPVHFAAATGHYNILEWFLKTSGSHLVDLRDAYRGTPAHDAAEYGHLECLKRLLQHGADLYALDHEGMSPYSLAIKDMESEVAEFVMNYAETGQKDFQEERQTNKKISQQNGEVTGPMDVEEIIGYQDNRIPSQNRRLSTASQVSMPRTLADDAFEITEARREVELALKNGPLQPGDALTAAARIGQESHQGTREEGNQSGSELDLMFSVEDHEPGHEMPDTSEGLLRLDSRGMLKQPTPDHFEGPSGGVYTRPSHVPSQKRRGETKPKLADLEGIDDNYVPEQEHARPQATARKLSTVSGPHYAEPNVVIRQPAEPLPKRAAGKPGQWHDDHGWYDDPVVGEEERQQARRLDPSRGYDRPMHPAAHPPRVPHGGRRQPHPGQRPPPQWVLQQQRMHREAWHAQRLMEGQPIHRRRPPPQRQPPHHNGYGVGPFDHEADVILIPRVVRQYHRLRQPHQQQFQPPTAAYPRRIPSPHSPAGTPASQLSWHRDDDIKFATLPAHIDYSRRAYDRMSHFQRAQPGYRPQAKGKGQFLQRNVSDKSVDSEYLTTEQPEQQWPEQRSTSKTKRKNKSKRPLQVSGSDEAIVRRNIEVGQVRARPQSEIVSDRSRGPQRTHLVPRLGYPRNGPAFDPYRTQSMSALDSSHQHKLVKRQEFSSYNEAMARRRLEEEDVDDYYSVPNALAYAAVTVFAAVAGIPHKQQRPMMMATRKHQQPRQIESGVSSKGPGAMIAEAYETGAAVGEWSGGSPFYSRSHHFPGQQAPSQYMSQEQRVTKGRKGKPMEPSKEKQKKFTKSRKLTHKTSLSSTASELQPVPEDEFEYNYEMERSEAARWAEEEESEEQDEREKTVSAQRVSGKDISEAYKTSRQNVWASMPMRTTSEDSRAQQMHNANAPTVRTSQAAARVYAPGTHSQQLKAQSIQPPDQALARSRIHIRQPVVGLSAKSRQRTGEGEDNLDVWWSTTTESGYSHPRHTSLAPSGVVTHHNHASAFTTHRHLGAVIDLGVTSTRPHLSQTTSLEQVPSIPIDYNYSQPEPEAVVGVGGIHVSHPSSMHFGTVEAAASSRPCTAEAQASVVVAGPPAAPPVPSHLVATATGKLDTRLVRQASPPATKVLTGAGTLLEPVEEEQGFMTAGPRSATRRSSKRSTGDLDEYLGVMTSADLQDQLTRKQAELMTLHRTLTRQEYTEDGNDQDEDDDEMMASPTMVGSRLVHQDEAMLMRQETLRQRSVSRSRNVEQLDRELQELRMMVPARDNFRTPKGSQATSPDSTLVRQMQVSDGSAMVMQQQAVSPAGQRAFATMIGRGPGAEGMARLAGRNVSISQIPLPLHTDGAQGRRMHEAMIPFSEETDSPGMVRSSSAGGMYYHYDATERDSSYKIGAIGPSVLAEKLKMAKATEGRNEAIAGDVVMRQTVGQSALAERLKMAKVTEGRNEFIAGDAMRQTGQSSVPRVSTTSNTHAVAVSLAQQPHTLAVQAHEGGLRPDAADELVEAKLTPVLHRKMAQLVQEGGNHQSSGAKQSDEEDEYMYVSVTGNKVDSKQAVLVQEQERAQQWSGKQVASSLQDDEERMSNTTDDTFIVQERDADSSGKVTPGSTPDTPTGEKMSSASAVTWKWQFAAQRSVEKKKRQGADEELAKALQRRQRLATATEALMTPVSNRRKEQPPHEQDKEGIKV